MPHPDRPLDDRIIERHKASVALTHQKARNRFDQIVKTRVDEAIRDRLVKTQVDQ